MDEIIPMPLAAVEGLREEANIEEAVPSIAELINVGSLYYCHLNYLECTICIIINIEYHQAGRFYFLGGGITPTRSCDPPAVYIGTENIARLCR